MRAAPLLLLCFLIPAAAPAQSFEQTALLRLTDSTPRTTRAVALGGASDPLDEGDMAANPATLASVRRPLLRAQWADNSTSVSRFDVADQAISIGSRSLDASGLSLAAAAIPWRGFVAGAYYASEPRLLGPEAGAIFTGNAAYQPSGCAAGGCFYLLPVVNAAFARSERRYGLAVAREVGTVAFGVGAEMQQLDERTEVARTTPVVTADDTEPHNERLFRQIHGVAVVPHAGIRWRVTPRVALAAAYDGAGSFSRTTSACNVHGFDWFACQSAIARIGQSSVRMPDAWRAGGSVAVTQRLRLVGEAVRRNYGNLAEDRYSIFSAPLRTNYRDVVELHSGAEYRLATLPLTLRAGWWRDPTRYALQATIPGSSVTHFTFGAGLDIGSARLQFAYDHPSVAAQRRAVVGIDFNI